MITASLPERFTAKFVVDEQGCWLWTAGLFRDGYGQFRVGDRKRAAHIVAYEALVGSVLEGHELDHACRVRRCCNPEHLEPVTRKENVQRGLLGRLKTQCPAGHPYEGDHVHRYSNGQRRCRICNRDAQRRCRERKQGANR